MAEPPPAVDAASPGGAGGRRYRRPNRRARRPEPGEPAGTWFQRWVRVSPLPLTALAFILVGLALLATPETRPFSHYVWLLGLVTTGAPVVTHTIRGMFAGQFAADIVATLAILTSVILLEPLPGLIVVLMQTGGEALERYAEGRASDAVRALEEQAPRIAHRVRGGATAAGPGDGGRSPHVAHDNDVAAGHGGPPREGTGGTGAGAAVVDGAPGVGAAAAAAKATEDVPVDEVQVGDLLLVRPGEMIPCDAVVVDGRSHVDAARLTGEPVPVAAEPGVPLMSGSLNQESPLLIRATALSRESQYARIVELVRTAQASKSPLQRLADRYAVWFTPLTLAVAGAAYLFSGEPSRILAVLVVATPCPLILATPVAIIGGINRAARNGIIIRHGSGLEYLGKSKIAVFDKTGTLTVGTPEVDRITAEPGFTAEEVLAHAASVEYGSGHLLARSVVDAAHDHGIALRPARDIVETPGSGVAGRVDGRFVAVGGKSYIEKLTGTAPDDGDDAGLRAYVAVDGRVAGAIHYADRMRPGLPAFFRELHELGIRRTVMLSGDHEANVRAVAEAVGVDEARADLLPQDKVDAVARMVAEGDRVLMVGDGINDAPALSTATVGIALAGHGGGITAAAADIVLLTDELHRVAEAIRISRRSVRIALQSIGFGLGLSLGAMVVAAFGYIPPVVGAMIQEAIDVAVVLNALRAAGEGREEREERANGAS